MTYLKKIIKFLVKGQKLNKKIKKLKTKRKRKIIRRKKMIKFPNLSNLLMVLIV